MGPILDQEEVAAYCGVIVLHIRKLLDERWTKSEKLAIVELWGKLRSSHQRRKDDGWCWCTVRLFIRERDGCALKGKCGKSRFYFCVPGLQCYIHCFLTIFNKIKRKIHLGKLFTNQHKTLLHSFAISPKPR